MNNLKNKIQNNYLLAHPRMATISPDETAILPAFTRHYKTDKGIGVIPVKGFLSSDLFGWFGFSLSYSQLQATLKKFEDDPEVKGVLLSVDSCGGNAAGAFEFAELINKFSKPIETYIEAEASSAAYLIASATKFITMHQSAFAGSIGAIVSDCKYEGQEIKTITNSLSPFKSIDLFDDQGAQRMTAHLDQIAEVFINDVARYRKTDAGNVQNNYGRGDVLFSKQALAVGMIDAVGNLQTALAHLQNAIDGSTAEPAAAPAENTEPAAANTQPKKELSASGGEKELSPPDNKKQLNTNSSTKNRNKNFLKRGSKMKRNVKTAFVLIDDSEVPEGATTVSDVTIETLDELFPDVMEQVRQKVKDEIAAGDQAVDDAAANADMSDAQEAEAVAAARRREITPEQLTQKLLKIKTERLKNPQTRAAGEMDLRGHDNPGLTASVGSNGTDLQDKTNAQRNGEGTASRIKNMRDKKRNERRGAK